MDNEEEEIILHLLWWRELKRGGHYFYLESRDRDLFLAFTHMAGGQDKSTVFCEPVFRNQSPLDQNDLFIQSTEYMLPLILYQHDRI